MAKKDEKTEKPVAKTAEKKAEPKAQAKPRKPAQAKPAAEAAAPRPAAATQAPRAAKGKEKQEEELPPAGNQTPRLLTRYRAEIVPALMKEFSYRNPMEVPRVKKVVLNIGLGEAKDNPKAVESAERDLSAITGQHPVQTKAKKS